MAERIGEIMEETLAFQKEAEQRGDIGPLRTDGAVEASDANILKLFAVGEYHIRHDIATFRKNLAKAAMPYIDLLKRSSGELPIEDVATEVSREELSALLEPPSAETASKTPDEVASWLLTMATYKQLFNALASSDRGVAERLAALMGNHLDPEVLYDQPLDHYVGWTLKYMVDELPDPIRRKWVEWLEGYLRQEWPTLIGYSMVMRAIIDGDLAEAHTGFVELLKEHRKESRKDKLFGDTEDEIICVWGVGLANLARWRGLQVDPHDPLIPSDLLV